ncbi:hypothetical protein K7711_04225 [Nocardia sp. CA2R105]|uniref:hypothetical protein n=1 Tax=Nocardia coffeae TaxID=2873381 RepID=UPI001CA5FBA7|nr:hypothetical protein [Nocardia coffeae]MBY8855675.1 hypothetical protein [Nocardia coffeae]
MTISPDDLWCDWCGHRNLEIHRYDDHVFCSVICVRQYRTQTPRPAVIDLRERQK